MSNFTLNYLIKALNELSEICFNASLHKRRSCHYRSDFANKKREIIKRYKKSMALNGQENACEICVWFKPVLLIEDIERIDDISNVGVQQYKFADTAFKNQLEQELFSSSENADPWILKYDEGSDINIGKHKPDDDWNPEDNMSEDSGSSTTDLQDSESATSEVEESVNDSMQHEDPLKFKQKQDKSTSHLSKSKEPEGRKDKAEVSNVLRKKSSKESSRLREERKLLEQENSEEETSAEDTASTKNRRSVRGRNSFDSEESDEIAAEDTLIKNRRRSRKTRRFFEPEESEEESSTEDDSSRGSKGSEKEKILRNGTAKDGVGAEEVLNKTKPSFRKEGKLLHEETTWKNKRKSRFSGKERKSLEKTEPGEETIANNVLNGRRLQKQTSKVLEQIELDGETSAKKVASRKSLGLEKEKSLHSKEPEKQTDEEDVIEAGSRPLRKKRKLLNERESEETVLKTQPSRRSLRH